MERKYMGKLFYEKEMELLRSRYRDWRQFQRDSKAPFFMIYGEFKDEFLRDISGGAVKLYLFLGFHVNSFTGECWVSAETISDFFGNDIRTVKKWFKELQEKGLIVRYQTGFKRKANTFLLPYGEGKDSD